MAENAIHKLHLYMGEGKGKTTAAMGLALRSLGHGNNVLIAQFMKAGNSGELTALRRFEHATVLTAPPIKCFTFRMSEAELEQTAKEQSDFAKELISEIDRLQPQTVILDELGIAAQRMIVQPLAAQLVDTALASAETIVTGRTAPEWLVERADYLSVINAARHPYAAEGLSARKGVEW